MKRNRRGREAAAFRAFARPESACERIAVAHSQN